MWPTGLVDGTLLSQYGLTEDSYSHNYLLEMYVDAGAQFVRDPNPLDEV